MGRHISTKRNSFSRQVTAILLGIALALGWKAGLAQQAPAAPAANGKPAAEALAPGPVPVPAGEIAVQAQSAATDLHEILTERASENIAAGIARELPAYAREIDLRLREASRILAQRPSLDLLRSLERTAYRLQVGLSRWTRDLQERIADLDRDLARLSGMQKTWTETLKAARASAASPDLIARVQALLADIEYTRATAVKQRTETLRVQSQVAALEIRSAEAVESIRQKRAYTLERIFQKDSAPVWRAGVLARAGEQVAQGGGESRMAQVSSFESYVAREWGRFVVHGALFALLAAGLYWARRRAVAWAAQEPDMERAVRVFAMPVATAFVLAFIGSMWIYPQAPRLLWAIIGAVALIPTAIVLRQLLARHLWPLLYAIVALYFVDQVRAVTASVAAVPRLLFLAEMLGGALFLLWFLRSESRADTAGVGESVPRRVLRAGAWIACAIFAAAAVANAAGYVSLANLVGNGILRSVYMGVILYAIVAIVDALVMIALRVQPLNLLRAVQHHRELLRRRVHLVLGWLAGGLWAIFVLERFALREGFLAVARTTLTSELEVGSISLSLGDVLAFVFTVWASFLASRFLRFVLNEEIYPHARLGRGLPYAISNTVHYAILVAGFLLAVAALGFDMTKFTILAGAFTVGVGFGLQQIFNNFVSGMILLFERPVQIGDVIQLDDATSGTVERIGIRASVVRSPSGSEVIVPNSKLISERVINWTFSERRRSVEVPVSIAHGADPKHVMELMERVAAAHPDVLKDPPPEALLVRPGPDSLGFELRAYIECVEEWMKVRSELAVEITGALAAEKIAIK